MCTALGTLQRLNAGTGAGRVFQANFGTKPPKRAREGGRKNCSCRTIKSKWARPIALRREQCYLISVLPSWTVAYNLQVRIKTSSTTHPMLAVTTHSARTLADASRTVLTCRIISWEGSEGTTGTGRTVHVIGVRKRYDGVGSIHAQS